MLIQNIYLFTLYVIICSCSILLIADLVDYLVSKESRLQKRDLLRKIASVNLHRMLKETGKDFFRYVQQTPRTDIERAISCCDRCTRKRQCNQILNKAVINDNDLDFCPINRDVTQLWTPGRLFRDLTHLETSR